MVVKRQKKSTKYQGNHEKVSRSHRNFLGPKKTKSETKLRKHPLRLPGSRPGDGCFVCKESDHLAKECPQKQNYNSKMVCLYCRKRGHTLKLCPDNNKNQEYNFAVSCYNCGEEGHRLSNCPQPKTNGGVSFASCFICGEKGHLSRACPSNEHGVYPMGGCCKLCGEVTHLAKECPLKLKNNQETFEKFARTRSSKIASGDDLEDDFEGLEVKTENIQVRPSGPRNSNVKVVHFK